MEGQSTYASTLLHLFLTIFNHESIIQKQIEYKIINRKGETTNRFFNQRWETL